MKKELIITIMILMLLVSCGTKTTGKRVAIPETAPKLSGITGGAPVELPKTTITQEEKTAAEALKEFQVTGTGTTEQKSGNFYPPVVTNATGEDALKEKTDALLRQTGYLPVVEADRETGLRYYDSDGNPTNLPESYSDNSGD